VPKITNIGQFLLKLQLKLLQMAFLTHSVVALTLLVGHQEEHPAHKN